MISHRPRLLIVDAHTLVAELIKQVLYLTTFGRRLLMTEHKNRQRFSNLISKASIAFATVGAVGAQHSIHREFSAPWKELPNSPRNLGARQLGFSLVCEGGRTREHFAVL
jgi:hypothetical protein